MGVRTPARSDLFVLFNRRIVMFGFAVKRAARGLRHTLALGALLLGTVAHAENAPIRLRNAGSYSFRKSS